MSSGQSPRLLRNWARDLVKRSDGASPVPLARAVAELVLSARSDITDAPVEPEAVLGAPGASRVQLDPAEAPPGGWADPMLPGVVHEQAISAPERTSRGAWYTPASVVRGLVALALPADRPPPEAVIDPTCGGGAFLVAALDRLVELGVAPARALDLVRGIDVDSGAVAVTRWAVALWAVGRAGADPAALDPERTVAEADSLAPLDGDGRGSAGGDGRGRADGERSGGGVDSIGHDGWPRTGLVIGNPPFASPLRTGAVPVSAEAYRSRRRDLLGPYSDLAAHHLLRSVDHMTPGSTVALVLPQSLLAGRDTAALRRHLDRVAPVRAMWAAREAVFDAGVRACAVVLEVGADAPDRVLLAAGPQVANVGHRPPGSWAGMAAGALGLPRLPATMPDHPLEAEVEAEAGIRKTGAEAGIRKTGAEAGIRKTGVETGLGDVDVDVDVDVGVGLGDVDVGVGGSRRRPEPLDPGRSVPSRGRLGDLASATAGFRDEYYGLVAGCGEWSGPEGDEPNRLMTVGGVEPLASTWGRSRCRFGRARWLRPTIDLDAVPPKVGAWVDRQAVPKLVVATQSKLLEPLIDRDGRIVPATPLLSVHADRSDLSRVAAVFLAPPVVAWAWERWFGTALSVDALKLAAGQVAELPLPPDGDAWAEAARLIDDADRDGRGAGSERSPAAGWELSCRVAEVMNRAYGAEGEVLAWWLDRGVGRGR